ncbi:MAG: HD domain-containing protein [Oscillospiraceae bacterium]
MILPENISCALDMLESAGHEAWVVGGCVRDSLMGIIPHDYDITTSALPAETEQVFAGYRLIETGLKHGTVTVLADGSPIEITTYRVDGEYRDSRRPERVTFTRNIRDDVSRRDFTMNGIAYNPKQGYFDEFGGAEDIKAGVIRCIGKPEKRFREDALRILRGLRFSASLGFEIEENTARAMHDTRELLNKISAERVFSELCGLLTGRNSHRNIFRVLTEFRDIAAVIIPEFRECTGFVQHSRFHRFDVYEHCVMSAQKAAEISADSECRLPLTLAMLLHDIGKPQRFTLGEDGEGHFYGHAAVSADIAEDILRRLKCSNALRERVCTIVRYHDVPLSDTDKSVRRLLRKYGLETVRDICLAHICDDSAKTPECAGRCGEWCAVLSRAEALAPSCCLTLKDLAVDGKALSGLMEPSPEMGKTLKFLLDEVINGNFPNEREFLLKEAAKYIAKRQKT